MLYRCVVDESDFREVSHVQRMNDPSTIWDAEGQSDESGGECCIAIESHSVLRILGEQKIDADADVSKDMCVMSMVTVSIVSSCLILN
jgi:hypothetical protein